MRSRHWSEAGLKSCWPLALRRWAWATLLAFAGLLGIALPAQAAITAYVTISAADYANYLAANSGHAGELVFFQYPSQVPPATFNDYVAVSGRVTLTGAMTNQPVILNNAQFPATPLGGYYTVALNDSELAMQAMNCQTSPANVGTSTGNVPDGGSFNVTITCSPPPPQPPVATTQAATGVSAYGATLRGSVNDKGTTTTASFDYGATTTYGMTAAAGSVSAGAGATPVSAVLTGLACNTTYHYRARAANSGGSAIGSDATFTTGACLSIAPNSQTNVAVNGGTNGAASVVVTGGQGPYSYSWAPSGGTAAAATGLAAGTYTVTVTDAAMRVATRSFTITQPPPIVLTSSSTPVSCRGGSNGTATVVASGGVPSYTYSWSPSGGTAATATGLVAGTYGVLVTDANAGTKSATVVVGQPASAPSLSTASLPGGTIGSAYSQAVTATGGTGPYTYARTGGNLPSGITLSIGGVLSGTPDIAGSFSFTVTASDANGCTVSRSYTLTISAVAPGAPVIGTATAGDAQATVSFAAPAINGGAAITGYTVTSSPGGFTGTCSASPCTVTGLTNGISYTFTVTATSSGGTGAASAASNAVTPRRSQTITFSNPGSQNFGTSPTLTASASSGLAVSFTSSTTAVCTIASSGQLTLVAAGACSVTANQAGNAATLAATPVTQTFSINAVVPGAPAIGTATAGNAQAVVGFTAPANNGGAVITGYTVTSSPGGFTGTCSASPCTVTGLTNGISYTFTVTATNSAGTGAASAASNAVTPKGTQTITFANPGAQNFGTSPTLTASASSNLAVSFSSDTLGVCTITSGGALTLVTSGTCTISANQAGNGAFLAATTVSHSFTVNAVVPGAPVIGTASAGDAQAAISFSVPASSGGATISGYTATASPGGATGSCAASPCTVTGLTNGTHYTFTVTATNSVGTGAASAASNAVVPLLRSVDVAGPTGPIRVSFTSSDPACTFASNAAVTTSPAPPTGAIPADPLYNFPLGLIDLSVTGCASGASIDLSMVYPGALPQGAVLRKYGLVNGQPRWYTHGTVAGDTVTLTLTDGGSGDDDGTADGVIRDPAGVGTRNALAGDVAAVPTLSQLALMLLSLVMGAAALRQRRRV